MSNPSPRTAQIGVLAARLSLICVATAVVFLAVSEAFASAPAQSIPGDAVYFTSTAGGASDIWWAVPGQKPQRAGFSAKGVDDIDPAVSSDGRWLAFASRRSGDFEIWVVDLHDGPDAKPQRVTTNTSQDTSPAWSPDGTALAYVTDRYLVPEIMMVPVGGCSRFERSCDTRVTSNGDPDIDPAWSPDGRSIAFSSRRSGDRGYQVYSMDPSGRSVRRLTAESANSTDPAWSPDGRSMAFVSQRSVNGDRTTAIYLMDAAGSSQTKVSPGLANEQAPAWAPDGRSITYAAQGRTSSVLYSVPTSGGRATQLMPAGVGTSGVAWGDQVSEEVVAAPSPTPTPTPTVVPPTASATAAPAPTATPPPTSTPAPASTPTPATSSGGPSEFANVLGFTVGISSEIDAAWESMLGGSLVIEYGTASTGTDQFHTTTPGHKYVEEVTLRGPVVSASTAVGEVYQDGAGKFSIDIDGLPTFSNNVQSIDIDPLTIDVRELTTGTDFDYRQYGPGDAHLGAMTITSRRQTGSASEAFEWWTDASNGHPGARRNISVLALKRDGSEGRRWDFFDCVPVTDHPFSGFSPDSITAVETLTVACGRVELSGGRNDLAQWINQTLQGATWQRNVSIISIGQDGSEGATYTYVDAFPTRYVFPSFSASGTGNLYEEISFKPIRLEVN